MYLKKRKQGYILLEVLLLVAMVSFLLMVNSKIIVENITKSSLYKINDDILTLTLNESNLIYEANSEINNNKELIETLADSNKVDSFNYNYTYSKDNNLKLKMVKGQMFLIRYENKKEQYRWMDFKVKKVDDKEQIIITPTKYISYNLNL